MKRDRAAIWPFLDLATLKRDATLSGFHSNWYCFSQTCDIDDKFIDPNTERKSKKNHQRTFRLCTKANYSPIIKTRYARPPLYLPYFFRSLQAQVHFLEKVFIWLSSCWKYLKENCLLKKLHFWQEEVGRSECYL